MVDLQKDNHLKPPLVKVSRVTRRFRLSLTELSFCAKSKLVKSTFFAIFKVCTKVL